MNLLLISYVSKDDAFVNNQSFKVLEGAKKISSVDEDVIDRKSVLSTYQITSNEIAISKEWKIFNEEQYEEGTYTIIWEVKENKLVPKKILDFQFKKEKKSDEILELQEINWKKNYYKYTKVDTDSNTLYRVESTNPQETHRLVWNMVYPEWLPIE